MRTNVFYMHESGLNGRFKNWEYPEIIDDQPTKYHWIVKNLNNFKLGINTDIGAFTYINAKKGVEIEDNVQIGSHCSIYSVSTIDNKQGKVLLKNGCCIGSHSVIMPGVTIGKRSIVGAFSFVNIDIPDDVLAYGVPVDIIKSISIK